MKKIISLYLITLLMGNALGAEISCRILFMDRPDGAPKSLYLFDGVSHQEVELPKLNLSKIYYLPTSTRKIALAPKPSGGEKAMPEGAPSVVLPEEAKDVYLIVTSDPENKIAPVRMKVIDASLEKVGQGQMVWYNLSDKKIQGQVGARELVLEPNQLVVLGKPAEEKGSIDVKLSYFRSEGKLRSVCLTQWSYNPKHRTVGLIFNKEKKLVPVVQNFMDFRIEKAN